MPFKKGEINNPFGAPSRARSALKWEKIDKDIAVATDFVAMVVDGTHPDIIAVDDPKVRLDLKIKATNALLKLAPQRHANEEGGPFSVVMKKYD